MSLTFVNKRNSPCSICLVWWNRDCANPPFRKTGWWNLAANGGAARVLSGSLNARYYYFHGEAWDGATWGTMDRRIAVINSAFNVCFDTIFEPNRIVGLLEVDTGPYRDFTVNLVG